MGRNRDFKRRFGNTVPQQLPAASAAPAFGQGEVETFLCPDAGLDPGDGEITPSLSACGVPHSRGGVKRAIGNIPVCHRYILTPFLPSVGISLPSPGYFGGPHSASPDGYLVLWET